MQVVRRIIRTQETTTTTHSCICKCSECKEKEDMQFVGELHEKALKEERTRQLYREATPPYVGEPIEW